MTDNIKTFEELVEACKNLYKYKGAVIDLNIIPPFHVQRCCGIGNRYHLFQKKRNKFKIFYSEFFSELGELLKYDYVLTNYNNELLVTSTNPQKIYNVIKAIKDCEAQDDN